MSSNINEVIRAVLNPLLLFYKKILHAPKAPKTPKAQKNKNGTKQKHKNANKWTKIKNALKKYLRGKRSLICLFAFLSFLSARRKKKRKKRNVSTMLSIGAACLCVKSVWTHYLCNCKCIHTDLYQLSEPRCVSQLSEPTLIFWY